MSENGATTGGLNASVVALDCEAMRLVHGNPFLHSISKFFEACVRIFLKVFSISKLKIKIPNSIAIMTLISIVIQIITIMINIIMSTSRAFIELTRYGYSTILGIYLLAFVVDPNGTKLRMVGFLGVRKQK